MSASGRAGGMAAEAEGIAQSDLLGPGSQGFLSEASNIQNITGPALDQYLQYLEQVTSSDPTQRTAAAGPQIAAINAQDKGAKKQVAQLPRGGESDYLNAQIDENSATQIGNAINQQYTEGEKALGVLGEQGISQYLQALTGYDQAVGGAVNAELGAGSTYNQVASTESATLTGILNAISNL